MLRFPKNRWAIILALAALAALGTMRGALADDPTRSDSGDPPQPPLGGGGDPDVPDGKTSTTAWNSTPQKRYIIEGRHAGDVSALRSDGLWRLIMILKGMRLFVFRF